MNHIDKWQMVDNLAQYILLNSPQMRLGQAVFNALDILDPKTADLIRGTIYDCFYCDDKIEQFKKKTINLWDIEQSKFHDIGDLYKE